MAEQLHVQVTGGRLLVHVTVETFYAQTVIFHKGSAQQFPIKSVKKLYNCWHTAAAEKCDNL